MIIVCQYLIRAQTHYYYKTKQIILDILNAIFILPSFVGKRIFLKKKKCEINSNRPFE